MNRFEILNESKKGGRVIPPFAYESPADQDKSEFLRRINQFGKQNPDFRSSIQDIYDVLTTLPSEDREAFNKIYIQEWENDQDKGFKEFCDQIERHVHSIDPINADKKLKDKRTVLKEAIHNYLYIKGFKQQRELKKKSIN